MSVLDSNNKHIIDYILEYFAEQSTKYSSIDFKSNKNNNLFEIWQEINNGLLNLHEIKIISNNIIERLKFQYNDKIFNKSFDDFFTKYIINSTELEKHYFVNNNFLQTIVTCDNYQIKHLYPRIFIKLWLNNIISFENEKNGLIIFNLLNYYSKIRNYLNSASSFDTVKILNFYINFIYQVYHYNISIYNLKKFNKIIKQNLYKEILNIKEIDLIKKYANYIIIDLKNYIGDYTVYYDLDTIMLIPVQKKHLEANNIISHINNNYCSDFDIEYIPNIDYIFLGYKKYIYIEKEKIKFVGIDKIDPHDEKMIKSKIRTNKLKNIFNDLN